MYTYMTKNIGFTLTLTIGVDSELILCMYMHTHTYTLHACIIAIISIIFRTSEHLTDGSYSAENFAAARADRRRQRRRTRRPTAPPTGIYARALGHGNVDPRINPGRRRFRRFL